MADDKQENQGITGLAESFDKIAKSAAAAALIFLIVFGCCYKLGEDRGQETGQQIRMKEGKHKLVPLPGEAAVLFWKDDKIIQGGLYGFMTVAALSTYVVLLFIFRGPSAEGRSEWVAVMLLYPNIMTWVLIVALFMGGFPMRFNAADAAALAASVVFVACAWKWKQRLALQIMLLVGQALLLSFFFGENRGVAASDLESRYPLVEVQYTAGGSLKDVRLLKTDESECRFMDANGRELMIPKSQIRDITVVPEPAQGAK